MYTAYNDNVYIILYIKMYKYKKRSIKQQDVQHCSHMHVAT